MLVGVALTSLVAGLSLRYAALVKRADADRTSGLLVAVGLVVFLPLAAITLYGQTTIDVVIPLDPVEEGGVDPAPALAQPEMRVRCAAVHVGSDDPFAAACADEAATRRWVAAGLAGVGIALVVAGSIRGGARRPDDGWSAVTSSAGESV